MSASGETRVGNATIHWRCEGQGPVIVLLHGFPLSGITWQEVVAALRGRFTCVMPDLVGLGGSSSTSDADYASQGQAQALSATLQALGIERYALVGNDTGGWVARELALVDGERVTHLVLTNTEIPGHRPPWIPTYQALARLPGFGAVLPQLLRFPGFLASPMAFGGCFHDRRRISGVFRDRHIAPLLVPGPAVDGVLRFLRCMKFARLDEFRRLHRDLVPPTLFVWGADDPTFPEPLARQMSSQFTRVAGFHSLPRSKLFFYEEHPREVAALIEGFVTSRG